MALGDGYMYGDDTPEDDGTFNYEELLIDGDLLVFSSCAAIEYGKEPHEYHINEILTNIDSRIVAMQKRVKAKKVRIFFTDEDNFRKYLVPSYKANRINAWIPDTLKDAKATTMVKWHGEKEVGLEADDLLAMNQKTDGTTIIATIDKDIPQVRGDHYRWETQHQGEKLFTVSGNGELKLHIKTSAAGKEKKEVKGNGIRFFCYQLLVGDPTDGVMGCGEEVESVYKSGAKVGQPYTKRVGVGPVAAYQLLEHAITYKRCMEVVIEQYMIRFGDAWEQKLLDAGRCLYMVNKRQGKYLQMWHYDTTKLRDSWYDTSSQSLVRFNG